MDSMDDDIWELRTPLLLQDICMLNVLLRIEDFPVQSLASLSHTIRRKIFSGLSHVDLLHLGDKTSLFSDVADPDRMSDARQEFLDALLSVTPAVVILSLPVRAALREEYAYYDYVVYEHVCESYRSLDPICITRCETTDAFLFPKRSLQFVDLESDLFTRTPFHPNPVLRPSVGPNLFYYCNIKSAPTELKIDIDNFKSTVLWRDFYKGELCAHSMMNIVVPFLQEFLSSMEVFELGTDATPNESDTFEEETHTISYVLLYNILTSSQPRLKHLKVYGVPVTTRRVMSTVVELLHATCTAPSKSIFHQYTGLEPLFLPTTPYLLEEISVLHSELRYFFAFEFMIPSHASSISRDMISVLKVHSKKLKSVTVANLGYCYYPDLLDILKAEDRVAQSRGHGNINVRPYRKFLTLLVEFIKQPQFNVLSILKSPLPEGYELILTFLCTAASHEQTLAIEVSDYSSAKIEKNWITEEDEMEANNSLENGAEKRDCTLDSPPTAKKSKLDHFPWFDPPIKPPCFPSEPLPLTNAQYKCLDLGHSSDCVYSWLFHQLPELKLKSLKMRTLNMTIVPANVVIQVEHIAFTTQTNSRYFDGLPISPAHLEKFVFSNPALKRLEFIEPTNENTASFLPMLNHCLQELDRQGRGLEELILTALLLDRFIDTQLKEFLIHLRDFSHRYGTTLVLSPYYFCRIARTGFFTDLSKEFEEKKIKKIICNIPDCNPTSQLKLLAEVVDIVKCSPPSIWY